MTINITLKKMQGILLSFSNIVCDKSNRVAYFIVTNKKLYLTMYSIDHNVSLFLSRTLLKKGVYSVNLKSLKNLVKAKEVTINEDLFTISSINGTLTLKSCEGMDIPIAKANKNATFNNIVNTADFLDTVTKVLPSTSLEDNHYVYNGIYFDSEYTASTDGKQLQKIEKGFLNGVIVHKEILKGLIKLMKRKDMSYPEMGIIVNKKTIQIVIGTSNIIIESNLLDGTFPDVNKVFPKETGLTIEIDKISFLNDMKIFKEKLNSSSFQTIWTIKDDQVVISGENSDTGFKREISLPVKTNGFELKCSFNSAFFIRILKEVKEEKVQMKLNEDIKKPVIFELGTKHTALIMPLII